MQPTEPTNPTTDDNRGSTRRRREALVGSIEAGGTKFVCALGSGPGDLERIEFPTTHLPNQVLSDVTDWLRDQQERRGRLRAIGIGSFGPVDLDRDSPTYGHITSTPKSGWQNTDIVGPIARAFPNVPIGFDTDVNAAALGEYHWGNAAGLSDFVYITIGTGIGAGGLARGRRLHGLVHPEMGHMMLPRLAGDDFKGDCPYHGRCWEGLCSGPAIQARTGMSADHLPRDHDAWAMVTDYIAYAVANIAYVLSPKRIIIGGSVRKAGGLGQDRFFQMIRKRTGTIINGYLASPMLKEGIGDFILPPRLGDDAGICGAIALAQEMVYDSG